MNKNYEGLKSEPIWKFNGKEWDIFKSSNNPKNQTYTNHIPKFINIATYNVLNSKLSIEKFLSSDKERYNFQTKSLFPPLNLDILALNEFNKDYADILMSSHWARMNYYISNPLKSFSQNNDKNLILSKFPMKCYSIDNILKDKIIIGLITLGDLFEKIDFLIISAHLTGYAENFCKRKQEIKQIFENITHYKNESDPDLDRFSSAINKQNVILLGDLNFHHDFEDEYAQKLGFLDLWVETMEFEDGFTWDPLENPLINVRLPFDNRRMRLDRILLKENAWNFNIQEQEKMIIFGNKKVYQDKCCSYLMPSDHFGLKIKLFLREEEKFHFSRKKLKIQRKNVMKFRSFMRIIIYRIISVLLINFLISMILFYFI